MAEKTNKFKDCSFCSEKILESATKCKHCGEWINNTVPRPGVTMHVSDKNKKIGIFWLVAPTLSMVMVLMLYAIAKFAFGVNNPEEMTTTMGIINVVLGFMGIITTFGILAGIPIGIVFLTKKTPVDPNIKFDSRSGKGDLSEIPAEIHGWSWGAAGLTWLWGISNGVWLSLLMFIPYFGLIWWIVLGIKGNEWAWKARPWTSTAEFIAHQNKWKIWGIIVFFLPLLMLLINILVVIAAFS